MAIVYLHKRKDNNDVFYVGIGKSTERAYSKDSRNTHWHSLVKKYGYLVDITHNDIIYDEAFGIEKYLIEFYGRKDLNKGYLVNKTDGGEGFLNFSKETLDIIRQKNIGRKHTEETKLKLKTYIRTESHKEHMRKARIGKKLSQEAIEKVRKFQMNKIVSDETRKRLSEARRKYWENKKKTCCLD